MLPFVARDICSYASSHGMKLNPSKCKELRIDFLQYKPSDLPPLQMSGSIIEQVPSYKLLGVHLSHNLSWSIHCDYIVKRARKRLYVLRVLMKSGLPPADLIQVYCSLVRPILEYASPVWAALPNCLVQLVESVQKSALGIIFPDCSYESAFMRGGGFYYLKMLSCSISRGYQPQYKKRFHHLLILLSCPLFPTYL